MTVLKTFSDLVGVNGIFNDGDWVESKDQDPDGEVRLIQLADIGVGKFINKSSRFMNQATAERLKCTYLQPGDILIARMPDPIGRACIYPNLGQQCVTVVDICIVRVDESIVDRNWLVHYINSDEFYKQINGKITGTTRKRISRGNLSKIKIPLPPLEDQKRIAAILDKADALRRKREKAIKLTDDLLRSVFLEMFGDPVTNPKRWPIQEIETVCSEIVDCVNRTAPVVKGKTPYKMIRTTNVRNYKIDTENVRYVNEETYKNWVRRLVPERGDIIFTREAPSGEAGIVLNEDKIFCGQRTMHFRPDYDVMTSEFLLFEIMSSNIKRQITKMSSGSTVTHLSVPECKKFQIRVPPIHLLQKFSRVQKFVAAKNEKYLKSNSNIEDLFSSLTQRAFRGELTPQKEVA